MLKKAIAILLVFCACGEHPSSMRTALSKQPQATSGQLGRRGPTTTASATSPVLATQPATLTASDRAALKALLLDLLINDPGDSYTHRAPGFDADHRKIILLPHSFVIPLQFERDLPDQLQQVGLGQPNGAYEEMSVRNEKSASLSELEPDEHILVAEITIKPGDIGAFPDREDVYEWAAVTLPGYSVDGKTALVVFECGSIGISWGMGVLSKTEEGWIVRSRLFWYILN